MYLKHFLLELLDTGKSVSLNDSFFKFAHTPILNREHSVIKTMIVIICQSTVFDLRGVMLTLVFTAFMMILWQIPGSLRLEHMSV